MERQLKLGLKIAFATLLLGANTWAISEQDYENIHSSKVMPYYESAGQSGTFTGIKGVPIYYRSFEVPNEKGAIVLVNGKGESTLKYAEVIYDLTQKGFSVYSMDHRNQGFSGKLTSDPQMVHVRKYSHYLSDFATFVAKVVQPERHQKLFMLGHSMGGAIGSLYLENYPGVFQAAAFSAPMMEINTSPYPEPVAYFILATGIWLGLDKTYAPGRGPYKPRALEEDPDTRSPVRHAHFEEMIAKNPSLAMGGPSFRWVKESMDVDAQVLKHAHEISTPILILQAEKDPQVRAAGQNEFCSKAQRCTISILADSYHETLMERDFIRDSAMSQIVELFSQPARK